MVSYKLGDVMNYPNGIKKRTKQSINYKNRGMSLEEDLNETNRYYREHDIAYIYKKPTPIQITKVDYPSRKEAIIKEAYFKEPSTTDYNGIYKGYYIDFEAKETKIKTSFPLSNIHPHQIEHMDHIIRHGGICFLIVRFTSQNETYLLKGKDLFLFLEQNERKSIPYNYFLEKAKKIPFEYQPRLHYLKFVDEMIGGFYEK